MHVWILMVMNAHAAIDGTVWTFAEFLGRDHCEAAAMFINEKGGSVHAWCMQE